MAIGGIVGGAKPAHVRERVSFHGRVTAAGEQWRVWKLMAAPARLTLDGPAFQGERHVG